MKLHFLHRWREKIFITILMLIISFSNLHAAEESKIVEQIREQVKTTIGEMQKGDGQFTAKDAYKTVKNVDVDPATCATQIFNGVFHILAEFTQFEDFLESFKDIFKRNDCHREDIWALEDLTTDVTNAMMSLATSCDQTSVGKMRALEKQYTALQWQIRLLRIFGRIPNSQADAIEYFESRFEQSEGADDEISAAVESVTYFNRKYLECPDDTLKTKLQKVIKRFKRVREKIKALWEEDIGGLTTFSEKEVAARKKRAKQRAKEWMNNINLGLFKVGPVTQTKENALGVPGIHDRLKGARDGLINLGNTLFKAFTPPAKTIEDVEKEYASGITHHAMLTILKNDSVRFGREKYADDLKKFYIQLFTQSSKQITQDLENWIILSDMCVRASFDEAERNVEFCNAGGIKSLPTFEKALKHLLEQQCKSQKCRIPKKWERKKGK